MRKEEKYIRTRCGNDNPFRVPEGYFDNFAQQLMNSLPASESSPSTTPTQPTHLSKTYNLRHWLYAAACIAGLFAIGLTGLLHNRSHSASPMTETLSAEGGQNSEFTEYSNEYIDEALDYALVNNQEIAYYLTEAY